MLLKSAFSSELSPQTVSNRAWMLAGATVAKPLLAATALLGVTVAAQFFSTRLGVSLKRLAPSLNRLNPLGKIKELPRQNIPVFVQSLILLPLFLGAVWASGKKTWDSFPRLPLTRPEAAAAEVCGALVTLMWRAGGLFLCFGLVDLAPAAAAPHQRPADEQAGDPRRIQGDRRAIRRSSSASGGSSATWRGGT